MKRYIISIMQDEETKRYTGVCDEVRGLVVEAETIEEVVEIAQDLLPDMVAANLQYEMNHGFPPLFELAKFSENRAV